MGVLTSIVLSTHIICSMVEMLRLGEELVLIAVHFELTVLAPPPELAGRRYAAKYDFNVEISQIY